MLLPRVKGVGGRLAHYSLSTLGNEDRGGVFLGSGKVLVITEVFVIKYIHIEA